MLTAVLFACFAVSGPESRIVLDGRFDDWQAVPAVLADPTDAPGGAVDLGEVRVAHDARFVHLLLDLGRPVNPQRLDGTIEIQLDADADPSTGQVVRGMRGVDAIIELSPPNIERPGSAGRGVGVAVPIDQPPPGDRMRLSGEVVGLSFAPTWSHTRFELRLRRDGRIPMVSGFLAGGPFRCRVEFVDRRGETIDRTDAFTYELTPVDARRDEQAEDPLRRAPDADLRIVTWNAEFGRLLTDPEPFGRVLGALAPDVVLLQELPADVTAPQLVAALEGDVMGGGRWHAVVAAGGGDQRCAVVARRPLRPLAELDVVPYPDSPVDSVRVAAAAIACAGRSLAVASLHLRCCGRAGSFEDRTRSVEALALQRALAETLAGNDVDGLIIGGDLNLVGSRWPLEILAEGLDADGTALSVAEALQIDGDSNATWSDPRQPFAPGRLDLLLYADSVLEPAGAFVTDTRDIDERWLRHHGLRAGDTVVASDHLPLVLDVRWADTRR